MTAGTERRGLGVEEPAPSPRLVDLSHPIVDGMPVPPGLPSPRIAPILDHDASRPRYDGQAEFYLGSVQMAESTGTYLDSPFHRYRDGRDLSEVPLESLAALPALVLDGTVAPDRSVGIGSLPAELEGRAVLVRTGWDRTWGSSEYWSGPYLSAAALATLVHGRPSLVGVDFANVDDLDDPTRRVHSALLRLGIPVVEHLRGLDRLPGSGFRFYAVPPAIVGGGSFPVRAFAELA